MRKSAKILLLGEELIGHFAVRSERVLSVNQMAKGKRVQKPLAKFLSAITCQMTKQEKVTFIKRSTEDQVLEKSLSGETPFIKHMTEDQTLRESFSSNVLQNTKYMYQEIVFDQTHYRGPNFGKVAFIKYMPEDQTLGKFLSSKALEDQILGQSLSLNAIERTQHWVRLFH